MSCNCSQTSITPPAVGTTMPQIVDYCQETTCPGEDPASVSGASICATGEGIRSTSSPGYSLPVGWTDALPDSNGQGIVLLGRIGSKLAKFVGSGFIQILNGRAFVVKSVALKITALWHQWWKPAGINKRPIIGEPYPFPLHVVSDSEGNLYGIKGIEGDGIEHDSIHVYSYERSQWETKLVADFPLLQRGLAPRITAGEILALPAIATSGASTDVRQVSVLKGSGIIVVTQQPTIPASCDCENCEPVAEVASVATFVPFPTVDGGEEDDVYSIKWSKTLGIHFTAD